MSLKHKPTDRIGGRRYVRLGRILTIHRGQQWSSTEQYRAYNSALVGRESTEQHMMDDVTGQTIIHRFGKWIPLVRGETMGASPPYDDELELIESNEKRLRAMTNDN